MQQQKHGKSEVYAEAFWRFSLAFYARPGVAAALIALQDRAGLDVNLMLFAIWRGAVHGNRLSEPELRAAEAAVAPFRRAVVLPLRELRRRLKSESDADMQRLRRQIAVLELAAERAGQARLASTVRPLSGEADRRVAAEANLALYIGRDAPSPETGVLRRAIDNFLTRG